MGLHGAAFSGKVEQIDGIFLSRPYDQRGRIISPQAGLKGRLTLRGGGLLVETPYFPGEYLVVCPPGFNVRRTGDGLSALNGGGNVIAQVGDDVMLGGSSRAGTHCPGECPGAYFKAYSVQRSPAR